MKILGYEGRFRGNLAGSLDWRSIWDVLTHLCYHGCSQSIQLSEIESSIKKN